MTLRKKLFGVAMVAALGTVLVSAQLSSATHVRPKGASPFYVPTVIAYKACGTPNSTHQGGVAGPSCVAPNGPIQESNFLTVGTPDANGAGANSTGFIRLVVKITSPEDVLITSQGTDVRCKPATATTVCAPANANAADGPDYTGDLTGSAQIRITDHWNGTSTTDAGTVTDLPFSVPTNLHCTATNSTTPPLGNTIGATCGTNTSANAVVPGAVGDTKRGNVEIQTIQIFDGGVNGIGGGGVVPPPPGSTRFATQGIFIP
jgi:hypothetical protein